MKCNICGKILQKDEALMCIGCVNFIVWKYGSLEDYEKARNKSIMEVKKNE